jgi:hypothetical protein
MSDKAQVFLAPHLRNTSNTTRHAAVTRAVTTQVTRKSGSMAPPAFQSPAPRPRRDTRIGLESPQRPVVVSYSLAESVAAVSAFLAAADHALVSAARFETANEEEKAQRMYARSVMLEYLAETTAKAARNSG